MRTRALIIITVYFAAMFGMGYAAAEWSWWLLLGLPVVVAVYVVAFARLFSRGRPETVDGRVVDRELY